MCAKKETVNLSVHKILVLPANLICVEFVLFRAIVRGSFGLTSLIKIA